MEISDYLKIKMQPGKKYAFLGIGSALNSDDAAGMYFIEILGGMIKQDNVLLIPGSTAPENFTGVIKDFKPDVLFVVDAAHMGLIPGDIKIVQACDISGVSFSTHMLPLTVMLKYLEAESGCDVIFVGIQPASTDFGLCMCDAVKNGVERLAENFCFILNNGCGKASNTQEDN